MKFGHEYETALANQGFPQEWVQSAIEYKHLKKLIKKVHRELQKLGLDDDTLDAMRELVARPATPAPGSQIHKEYFSAANPALDSISEEFTPALRILVDGKTGEPLDARLTPETKASLQKLAKHEIVVEGRRNHLHEVHDAPRRPSYQESLYPDEDGTMRKSSVVEETSDSKWVQVPLSSARDFFDMLEPKLGELEALRDEETHKLEEQIMDLGDAVENVVAPVREGYEAHRKISYRDLYFWREMFRLYLETPIFYRETEQRRGALTFDEAKSNLEKYDKELRETGLLAKMKTPQAKAAAQQFLNVNLQILKTMQFQEMNARAMRKILKKFDKQTHLEGNQFLKNLQIKYPALLPLTTNKKTVGFADSIARDLQSEISTKVLGIVPQLDDWICPVCYGMAWRPVNLGCCRSVFCITCIIQLQDQNHDKCPVCNREGVVMRANGMNIDFETMDFLGIYFPMEVKKRQGENERKALVRERGEEFVGSRCVVM